MTATRTETDTFGPIEVPADRYWGAQTQRSLQNFKIGWEKQPQPMIRALGVVKRAAAEANMALGKGLYLICNNTVQSMDAITKDPLWLGAQVPFVELSDEFREDPVVTR